MSFLDSMFDGPKFKVKEAPADFEPDYCPVCEGKGGHRVLAQGSTSEVDGEYDWADCEVCGGACIVTEETLSDIALELDVG